MKNRLRAPSLGKGKVSGVSWKEKLSYGIGDLACASLFNVMSSYLLYFYTDVAGVAVGAAGSIISVARLADAAANPFVGLAIDKTKTRWGSLRPYVLFSMVPLALSFALVFLTPSVSPGRRPVYAFISYLIFSILYTVCNIPYTALMSCVTEDERDRSHLNMTKQISSSVGVLVSVGLAMPLITRLGGGNEKSGFLRFGILLALLTILLLSMTFWGTRERVVTQPQKLSLSSFFGIARKSKPWMILCVTQVCLYFATSTKNASTLYYAKYYLSNSNFAGVLLSVGTFTTILCAFTFPKLITFFKKKSLMLVGYALFILSCFGILLSGGSLPLVFLFNLMGSLGKSAIIGVTFLMLGECIDHSEYVTGIRQQGMLTSIYMLAIKIGVVLSSLSMAFIMKLGGYQADVAQSAQSLLAIRMNYVFIPAMAALISFMLLQCYHLDDSYAEVNTALHQIRQKNRRE